MTRSLSLTSASDDGGDDSSLEEEEAQEMADLREQIRVIFERMEGLGGVRPRRVPSARGRNEDPETIKVPGFLGPGTFREWRTVIRCKIVGAAATLRKDCNGSSA